MDEKEKRGTEALQKAKAVYDRILNGVSAVSLPAQEKAAATNAAGKAAMVEYTLDNVVPEAVESFCKENKLTENALFTAGFAYLLARMGGSEEALFSAIYNGRTRLETLRIMGMLVKTYPMYVTVDQTQTIKEYLLSVQKRIQDMTGNDLYSFAEASRDYGVSADVLFAYQGDSFTGFTLAGQKAAEIPQPLKDAKEPLSVDVWKALLEAAANGLDSKIMRLGNLMGRHSDGEFQANFRSNAFIRSLAGYKAIGAIPYSMMNAGTDFSEIDMTARAILLLSGTDRKSTVFHPVNNHTVTYADIVYSMREYGFQVDAVEDEEFSKRMEAAGEAAGALIAYNSREGGDRRYMLDQDCGFTTNALYRLGFKRPVSGERYIVQMLKNLDELIMFKQ